jgi:hypothetical protein
MAGHFFEESEVNAMVSELALTGNGGEIVIYITALFYAIYINLMHL